MTNAVKKDILTVAEKYIGVAEYVGKLHNPTIIKWLDRLKAWWREDETPWCGIFVANILLEVGKKIPKDPWRAKSYENYGVQLKAPCVGAIGVMRRKGGGHVCIIAGQTKNGDLVAIGGNQNNKVCYAAFPRERFTAYRWAGIRPNNSRYTLPVIDVSLSNSEA